MEITIIDSHIDFFSFAFIVDQELHEIHPELNNHVQNHHAKDKNKDLFIDNRT